MSNITDAYDRVANVYNVIDYVTGVRPHEVVNDTEHAGHDYILLHTLDLLREVKDLLRREQEVEISRIDRARDQAPDHTR